MADIMELFPSGMTPKTHMETLVNGVGLRLVVVNWLMTAWAALWAFQLFVPSTIVLGIVALLLGWMAFSLIWYTPGGPLTRPFDNLFIHSPLKLWFLITLTLDFPLSLFIALGWNYPYTRPDMYARKQWEAFAFIVSMHTVGVLWVFFRQDLTITIGGLWIVLSIMLQRPKAAPVFAVLIIFAVLYPLTYISTMAWKRLRHEENEGRIALPPDEEEVVAGNNFANGNDTQEDAALTLGAAFTIPNSNSPLSDIQKRNIKNGIKDKLSYIGNQRVLKAAGEGIKAAGTKGVNTAGKGLKVAGNGVKVAGGKGIKAAGQGVKVAGQAVHDNPVATAALLIGASIFLTELISGGMVVPVTLRAIGFGVKGPVKKTIAAAVQRIINPVKLGSMFSKVQSAAMGGAAISQLQTIAHIAVTGLIGAGVVGLIGSSIEPHKHVAGSGGWRDWMLDSKVDVSSDIPSNASQFWGISTYGECVAYGYREFRAALAFVPEADPLTVCTQTPALIEGIGYKTPLGCINESPDNGVVGIWYVPTTTQCMPKWDAFEDEVSAVNPGMEDLKLYRPQRKFARLMGLTNKNDWIAMCESTPAVIDGKDYGRPSHCDDKFCENLQGVLGIYGVFDMEDKECECSCLVLVTSFTTTENDGPWTEPQQRTIKDEVMDRLNDLPKLSELFSSLGGDRKAEALKAVAQGAEEILGRVSNLLDLGGDTDREIYGAGAADVESDAPSNTFSFDGIMPACAEQDCKKKYFMRETMRWVKQVLNDAGVVIYENPAAATALFIGVSVLLANLISGGMLIPAALQAIGFGAKGPIRHTIATAMQRKIDPIRIGSMFSKLQSAAMGGAAMEELQKIANAAVTGLIGISAFKLVGAAIKPLGQSTDFNAREWRSWESESRFDIPSKVDSRLTQLWGTPVSEGCVAYGYREIRAPLWFIPEGKDPLSVCVRTPAFLNGMGYKTPLGCVDEGPKKGVVGMWYVPTNETRCMPRWNTFEDEGCMLYGRRRKFARLMGLKGNDDWNGVCESTPAKIGDKHYDGPSYCEDKGLRGIYGIFDVVDEQCECSCVRI
ncbi:unnamed protein product [Rhizoctonia solani]|uniref:Uncharacterized protein n=1 Tax=Rhizoctonia solani TaxID=456999 RepID=A0A8H2WRP0_9AGAM|nr:unnamed protein product [Rhizoctonia solani]